MVGLKSCRSGKRHHLDCRNHGESLVRFLQRFFNKLNQFGEVAFVGVFHGPDVVLANLVPLRQELDLRPLRNGVVAGV